MICQARLKSELSDQSSVSRDLSWLLRARLTATLMTGDGQGSNIDGGEATVNCGKICTVCSTNHGKICTKNSTDHGKMCTVCSTDCGKTRTSNSANHGKMCTICSTNHGKIHASHSVETEPVHPHRERYLCSCVAILRTLMSTQPAILLKSAGGSPKQMRWPPQKMASHHKYQGQSLFATGLRSKNSSK
jgi:hypothetical protein